MYIYCLTCVPGIIFAFANTYTPTLPCLKGSLVEDTTICAILKISGDYCFLQEATTSYRSTLLHPGERAIHFLVPFPNPFNSPPQPSARASNHNCYNHSIPLLGHTNATNLCIYFTNLSVHTLQQTYLLDLPP